MSLYQLPLNRVVERRLCREYYAAEDPTAFDPAGEIREELCKVDAVQRELAWIQGAMESAWIVGDFVMTIPLGFVAEKYGRRTVLWLNLVPRICMLAWAVTVGYFEHLLPTKAILAAPMLSVLGGDCVFNSIVYALASDMTDDRTLRATYFAYIGSTSYVVALLGPALASATMTIHLWLPFYIGITLLLACIWTITALHSHDPSPPTTYESSPLLSSPLLKAQDHPSLSTSISYRFTSMRSILTTHPRNFTLLLASFFLTSLASSDTKLLVQYISKRYAWTFASAGYLLSGKAVVNFVLLTLVIPRVLAWRNTPSAQRHTHDGTYLTYAKICIAISVLGAVSIALASTIPLLVPALLLYALGSALPVFTMSLLKSPLVSPTDSDGLELEGGRGETQVFSVVMLTKTLGSLVGAPLMAGVWMRGIAVGGAGLGLPYFVSAGCYVMALVVVSGMRVS
ncbi:major facilitator superfamily domain-containing protein [Coniochaeta sp. 2T2.1]|nr:major facilitator superfamily domain-containing protein [Coniochaeta sp. 2T2.1]